MSRTQVRSLTTAQPSRLRMAVRPSLTSAHIPSGVRPWKSLSTTQRSVGGAPRGRRRRAGGRRPCRSRDGSRCRRHGPRRCHPGRRCLVRSSAQSTPPRAGTVTGRTASCRGTEGPDCQALRSPGGMPETLPRARSPRHRDLRARCPEQRRRWRERDGGDGHEGDAPGDGAGARGGDDGIARDRGPVPGGLGVRRRRRRRRGAHPEPRADPTRPRPGGPTAATR